MTDTERYTRDAERDAVWGLGRLLCTTSTAERRSRAQFKRELREWIKERRDKRAKATKGGRDQ